MQSNETPANNQPLLLQNTAIELKESEIVASFSPPAFIENIALNEVGDVYVTNLEEGAVYSLHENGETEIVASVKGQLAGICFMGNSTFLLNGWDENRVATIWLLKDRNISLLLQPEGALFLNGMIPFDDHHVLICDSYKGCIWIYSLEANQASVWLDHPLLKRSDKQSLMPAANGMKLYKNHLFVSNTQQQLLLQIPVANYTAGEPAIFLSDVNLDDFAIGDDGTIYATTHIFNSVLKIAPDKTLTLVAGADQGATGSTAVAFGKRTSDKDWIYVTTNGGLSLPPETGLEAGKVIKIRVK